MSTAAERINFADPYKVCTDCGGWVTGVYKPESGPIVTIPCEHFRGYDDVCPSWGPVDGCTCLAGLGHVKHGEPPIDPDRRLRIALDTERPE